MWLDFCSGALLLLPLEIDAAAAQLGLNPGACSGKAAPCCRGAQEAENHSLHRSWMQPQFADTAKTTRPRVQLAVICRLSNHCCQQAFAASAAPDMFAPGGHYRDTSCLFVFHVSTACLPAFTLSIADAALQWRLHPRQMRPASVTMNVGSDVNRETFLSQPSLLR